MTWHIDTRVAAALQVHTCSVALAIVLGKPYDTARLVLFVYSKTIGC
jgi:hypothetical protein